MELPEYINCDRKGEIVHCDFYMTSDCPETCAYALDIGGVGVGALDEGVVKLLNRIREEELNG